MTNHKSKTFQNGFTLIETLVYIGLFSFLIGGIIMSSYQIIRASDRIGRKLIVDSEADFILKKIEWAMNGASQITTPPGGASSITQLVIQNTPNNLIFDVNGGNIFLKRGSGGASNVLNTPNVSISAAKFDHITGGGKPDALIVNLTINGRSFGITKYLGL